MIVSKTPLRVSLLGGNTDFPEYFKKHGGAVLTTTINKYIYCIVKKRFDKEIRINYSIKEIVTDTKDIKHNLVREAMRLVEVTEGIEITFLSDIPSEGSGLGSSSALLVGLLNALHAYKNESCTLRQLAEEACKIEVDILKQPIGYQDQYAVAFGGFNLIEFGDKITVKKVSSPEIEESLMLFYTGKTRSSNKILAEMKLDERILGINKSLVYMAIKNSLEFGEYLHEYWLQKVMLNRNVTDEELNKYYQMALESGAHGGKIVGAGGGGFLLLSAPDYIKRAIRRKLPLEELPFKFSHYGSRIVFNDE